VAETGFCWQNPPPLCMHTWTNNMKTTPPSTAYLHRTKNRSLPWPHKPHHGPRPPTCCQLQLVCSSPLVDWQCTITNIF